MKKIFLLIIPFLLTGCASVSYNLKINKDLSVVEDVKMTATKEYFDSYYKNLPITIVKQAYESEWMDVVKQNEYDYKLVKDNVRYPTIFVNKKYDNLNKYTKETIFKGESFENILVIENNNLITIKTDNFLPYLEDQDQARFPISQLVINIQVPYVVTNSNADKKNMQDHIYTWIINEKTENKEINITFDKTKIYIYNLTMYISMIIIGILIVIGIIVIIKIRNKNKINNTIG